MSQLPNTLFTSYCESHAKDIDNMDGVKRDQGQIPVLVPTNNQDLLTDLCQMRDEIITM